MLEVGFDADVAAELARRGHDLITDAGEINFGGAQLILRTEAGSHRPRPRRRVAGPSPRGGRRPVAPR